MKTELEIKKEFNTLLIRLEARMAEAKYKPALIMEDHFCTNLKGKLDAIRWVLGYYGSEPFKI